jgi:hypothetical protein
MNYTPQFFGSLIPESGISISELIQRAELDEENFQRYEDMLRQVALLEGGWARPKNHSGESMKASEFARVWSPPISWSYDPQAQIDYTLEFFEALIPPSGLWQGDFLRITGLTKHNWKKNSETMNKVAKGTQARKVRVMRRYPPSFFRCRIPIDGMPLEEFVKKSGMTDELTPLFLRYIEVIDGMVFFKTNLPSSEYCGSLVAEIPEEGFTPDFFVSLIPDQGVPILDFVKNAKLTPELFKAHLPTLQRLSQARAGLVTKPNTYAFFVSIIPEEGIAVRDFARRSGLDYTNKEFKLPDVAQCVARIEDGMVVRKHTAQFFACLIPDYGMWIEDFIALTGLARVTLWLYRDVLARVVLVTKKGVCYRKKDFGWCKT